MWNSLNEAAPDSNHISLKKWKRKKKSIFLAFTNNSNTAGENNGSKSIFSLYNIASCREFC
jgi:hypothetical protein